jgi:hypothetical protein
VPDGHRQTNLDRHRYLGRHRLHRLAAHQNPGRPYAWQLDAVVFDAPVLLYYAAHGGKGRVQVVGGAFHKEDYGIVFPPDSPLRKQVNGALLGMREDGTYDQIYDRWFANK